MLFVCMVYINDIWRSTSMTYSVFYYGKMGSGKTLRAVIDAYLDYKSGREIWSNIKSLKIPQKYIETMDLISIVLNPDYDLSNIPPKTLILDETHTQADSRISSSFVNRNLSYFISQCRKFGFNVIYVSQFIGGYDVRLRQLTDEITRCVRIQDSLENPIAFEYITWSVELQRITNRYKIPVEVAKEFYKLYNTYERIRPVEQIIEVGESN